MDSFVLPPPAWKLLEGFPDYIDMADQRSSLESIQTLIHIFRGQRVVLDADLATIYGTTTKRLNEQVRRNHERFPREFMFQLSNQEVQDLRSQFATAKWAMRRVAPYAFTEHGALMAANVLNSPLAIQSSIALIKAFIEMRKIFSELTELKRRQSDIERRMASGFAGHEEELREIRIFNFCTSGKPTFKETADWILAGGRTAKFCRNGRP